MLHRAADMDNMPTMKETKYLLPKPALTLRDVRPPQWVNLVQSAWREVENLTPIQAKAQVVGRWKKFIQRLNQSLKTVQGNFGEPNHNLF